MQTQVEAWINAQVEPNPGPAGWAALLECNTVRKMISGNLPYATNHQAELTAAIEVLSVLKWPCTVTIYSRSQYIVSVANGKARTEQHADLWEQLYSLTFVHTTHWEKIGATPQYIQVKSRALNEMRSVGIEVLE